MTLENFRTVKSLDGYTEYKYFKTYYDALEYKNNNDFCIIQVLKRIDMNNYRYSKYNG